MDVCLLFYVFGYDLKNLCYLSHMISFMLNDIIATWATRWRWLGAPRASRSSSACFAITNILRTSLQLNGDRLDPSTGLAAD